MGLMAERGAQRRQTRETYRTMARMQRRRSFVESLARVVRTGGRYFLLCFSDDEPPGWGPRRVTQAEIRGAFAPGWRVDRIEPAELYVTIRSEPVRSWFASIRRT